MSTENETLAKALADVAIGQQALIQALADPPKDPAWQETRRAMMQQAVNMLYNVIPELVDKHIKPSKPDDIYKARKTRILNRIRVMIASFDNSDKSAVDDIFTKMQKDVIARVASERIDVDILSEFGLDGLFEVTPDQYNKILEKDGLLQKLEPVLVYSK